MNCTQVEKLLPLYVEGDLKDARGERAVEEHLYACDACRQRTAEFRASQELLHGFEAPEFDAAFYDGIRRAVLTEIRTRATERRPLMESFRLFLLQRPALAASAMLLMLVSGVLSYGVLQSMRNSSGQSHPVAIDNGFEEISPNQFNEEATIIETVTRPVKRQAERKRIGPQYVTFTRGKRRGAGPAERDAVRPEVSNSTGVNNASRIERDVPRDEGATADNRTTTQAIARMEIRTSDPNIRIIWLGRKAGE